MILIKSFNFKLSFCSFFNTFQQIRKLINSTYRIILATGPNTFRADEYLKATYCKQPQQLILRLVKLFSQRAIERRILSHNSNWSDNFDYCEE